MPSGAYLNIHMGKKNIYFLLLIAAIFSSCTAEKSISRLPVPGSIPGIRNSIIFLIHGDGSYLYHDSTGAEINSDERIAEQARAVGEKSLNSEVFIFHIKISRHLLFFFPLKDRELFHYYKGQLINSLSYSTDENDTTFETEANYFKRYTVNSSNYKESDSIRSLFLYYGHQIPEFGGFGYNSSFPSIRFNLENFAKSLENFKKYRSYKFNIVVLSTCSNATPGGISILSSLAKFVIASPVNLHLSQMNSLTLIRLDSLRIASDSIFAGRFAQAAFDSLKKTTQTEISISVFNTDKTGNFLKANGAAYFSAAESLKSRRITDPVCIDCQRSGYMNMDGAEAGVVVYQRPSLFGRKTKVQGGSGWGCWKLPGKQLKHK